MIGAIIGDIVGSIYEFKPIKTKEFPLFSKKSRFTDDTVLTVAVGKAILEGTDYQKAVHMMGRKYPGAGYGGNFTRWLQSDEPKPYGSWGNGSAMRVSPVGFAFNNEEEVLEQAERSAVISHNHSEGIKGAQATALSIYFARTGHSKESIRREINKMFSYDLNRKLADIRPNYGFDVSCQGSVPESIICFLESESFEDAVRNAVSLGGDSDTMASISGGIAEAYYGPLPKRILDEGLSRLTDELKATVQEFYEKFMQGLGPASRILES